MSNINNWMKEEYSGAAYMHNLECIRQSVLRDKDQSRALAVAITLACRMGYGRNALVIDASNVTSAANKGIQKATPLSQLKVAAAITPEISIAFA